MKIKLVSRFLLSAISLVLAAPLSSAQSTSEPSDSSCSSVAWTPGVNYPGGTVVYYQAVEGFYKVVRVGDQGSNGTVPTDATGTWSPTVPCIGTAWPNRIVGGYYPNWAQYPPRLSDINPNYNVIYLFSALPNIDGMGGVHFTLPNDSLGARTNFIGDLAYLRHVQGRKVILSVGGSHGAISFSDRTHAQAFLNSIETTYTLLGGFDGLDWDTYEGSQSISTDEMIWISQQLKINHPGFLITTPPAPWSQTDLQFCRDMIAAGALDFAAPQFYDGPGLADPANIERETETWVNALGASHVVIGFGVQPNTVNYETIDIAVATWRALISSYPTLRGTFDWQIVSDQAENWAFARQIALSVQY